MTALGSSEEFDTDLDLHSEEFREHNYALLEELRGTCPVAKTSAWGGHWLFTSYDAVFDACGQAELFSNGPEKAIPALRPDDPHVRLIPIEYDAPKVQQYRKLLLGPLSPKAAKRTEDELRSIATELIDSFIEKGEADLAFDVFTPLPARWILRLCEFDESDWPQWIEWIHSMVHDRASEPDKAVASTVSIATRVSAELAKRREDLVDGDRLSELIKAEIDGERLTDEELLGVVFLLLLGGMDTTAGLTGNAFLRIAADDRLRERLIGADAKTLDRATEEFLRHDTPTQGLTRVVTRDTEFHGRELKQGDRVMVMFAAANRDPDKFDRPDVVDIDRPANQHVAFSLGHHRCLGSNFARLMFQVMISEVLRRMPDVQIAGPVERIADAGDVYAVKHLPVAFTAGRREGPPRG